MKGIKDKLERVATLIESGDTLERDLALELLREVYTTIKFGEIVPAETESEAGIAPEPEPESEQEQEPEPVPVASEPPIVPRRVAPDVIRSLYGTETEDEAPEPIQVAEPEQEPEPQQVHEPETEPEPKPETEQKTEQKTDSVEKPATTLADAMAAGHRTLGETLRPGDGNAVAPTRTLGETLRSEGGGKDMASHIAAAQAAQRPGLKRSIGLNDRFLMIRDMFDGDAAAFDRAITRLDTFTDLDEAVIWIHDNFDWSADNKGVTLLMGLLERKLGH